MLRRKSKSRLLYCSAILLIIETSRTADHHTCLSTLARMLFDRPKAKGQIVALIRRPLSCENERRPLLRAIFQHPIACALCDHYPPPRSVRKGSISTGPPGDLELDHGVNLLGWTTGLQALGSVDQYRGWHGSWPGFELGSFGSTLEWGWGLLLDSGRSVGPHRKVAFVRSLNANETPVLSNLELSGSEGSKVSTKTPFAWRAFGHDIADSCSILPVIATMLWNSQDLVKIDYKFLRFTSASSCLDLSLGLRGWFRYTGM